MTNDNNVGNICPECADARKKAFQENVEAKLADALKKSKQFSRSMYVKKAFEKGRMIEHMWVQVSNIDFNAKKVFGKLSNEPKFSQNSRLGDNVELSIDEVESISF